MTTVETDTMTDIFLSKTDFCILEGNVDNRLLSALRVLGFTKPTRIQALTLPHLLLSKDLIGAAKTGSGKTLAYLIPVLNILIKLGFRQKHGTGSIILAPTRELALQIYGQLNKLLAEVELTCALIVGGEKKKKEIDLLSTGVNIVVATPGRLLDHLTNTEAFVYKNLKCLVVDEADKLLEAGFERCITAIIQHLPKDRQTVLFSATIDENVQNLARLALRNNPVVVSIKDHMQSTVEGLTHGYCICAVENRIPWLFRMLKRTKKQKVMVFFSSCKSVDFHYEFFRNHCKAGVLNIHGKLSQAKRKLAYHNFMNTKYSTLFCTDVAARGLDIPAVDWIIQFDPPSDPKEYIHRVGRTARGLNGKGNAVLLLRPEEEEFVNYLSVQKVYLDKYKFDAPPEEIQQLLEKLIENNGQFKSLARKAYLSFLRCYAKHPLKKIFNIKTLNLHAAGRAFGFTQPPHVDFLKLKEKNK